jgi:hypothetical protein
VLFVGLTLLLAYGDPRDVTRKIVGNPGDPYLIYSLLVWGADKAFDFFAGYSDGPMFASGSRAMAYSDTFLPLVVPFRIAEVSFGSSTFAFNLLYLVSWILCCEFTYRLALRCCTSRPAALVGAVAFTFTTLRLAQAGHFQLAWGSLVPLAFIALLRLRTDPSIVNGVLVACVVVAQFLTSAYYGVVLLVGVLLLIVVYSADAWRRNELASVISGHASAVGTMGVLMLPIFAWYRAAEDEYVHRDVYPGYFRLRLGDLRSPGPTQQLPRRIPWFDTDPALGSSESFAYVGLFVLIFVPAFVVLLLVYRRLLFSSTAQVWALASIGVVGMIAAAIAVGRGPIFGIRVPFYDIARAAIPGVESILAIVRLFIFMQLALVIAGTVALGSILGLIRVRWLRPTIAAIALVLVVLDCRLVLESTQVPGVADGSVYAVMKHLSSGKAVELPIPPLPDAGRPYLESTRMLLGSHDDLQIVNGHSGHWPVDYEQTVSVLNEFPSKNAIDELNRIGVRYVVLHGGPVDTGSAPYTSLVNSTGYAFYEPDELSRVRAELPSDAVVRTWLADDGIIVELR